MSLWAASTSVRSTATGPVFFSSQATIPWNNFEFKVKLEVILEVILEIILQVILEVILEVMSEVMSEVKSEVRSEVGLKVRSETSSQSYKTLFLRLLRIFPFFAVKQVCQCVFNDFFLYVIKHASLKAKNWKKKKNSFIGLVTGNRSA